MPLPPARCILICTGPFCVLSNDKRTFCLYHITTAKSQQNAMAANCKAFLSHCKRMRGVASCKVLFDNCRFVYSKSVFTLHNMCNMILIKIKKPKKLLLKLSHAHAYACAEIYLSISLILLFLIHYACRLFAVCLPFVCRTIL